MARVSLWLGLSVTVRPPGPRRLHLAPRRRQSAAQDRQPSLAAIRLLHGPNAVVGIEAQRHEIEIADAPGLLLHRPRLRRARAAGADGRQLQHFLVDRAGAN